MSDLTGAPTVLVVIPTLGERPDYIARAFDSLDAQSDVALTVAVVAPAAALDLRAECERRGYRFVTQTGRGMSNAINEGWTAYGSTSDYWAWLGDDDELTPDSLRASTVHLMRRSRSSMVYGRCRYVDGKGALLFEARPGRLATALLRWGPDLIPQPGSVARATSVRAAGLLDESLRYAMDLDLFLRLKDHGRIDYLPVALASFRWHEGSTTVAGLHTSASEARMVRQRTWVGRRRVGPLVEPVAMAAGRVLHRVQRRKADRRGSLPSYVSPTSPRGWSVPTHAHDQLSAIHAKGTAPNGDSSTTPSRLVSSKVAVVSTYVSDNVSERPLDTTAHEARSQGTSRARKRVNPTRPRRA